MRQSNGKKNFSYRILPRFLRDVSNRTMTTTVLEINVSMPLGVSPTAMQKLAHPQGEVACARGEPNHLFLSFDCFKNIRIKYS